MGMPPMLGDESPGIISIDIGRPKSIDIGRASDTCSAASWTGWLPAYIASSLRFSFTTWAYSASSTAPELAGAAEETLRKNRKRPEDRF